MRKNLFALSLLISCSTPVLAEDQNQLVGVWKLQTYVVEFQDTNERKTPFGEHPNGYGIFTPDGRTMAILTAEDRKTPQTEADRALAFSTMVAYTGIYRIEGDRWITKVDTAWNEAWTGTDQIRYFKLDGDELQVTSNWRPYPLFDGRVARGLLTWTRVR
jgi:hypothetical protein